MTSQPTAPPTVRVAGIEVLYGTRAALSGLDVTFPVGLTALVGPNGAGKSTLLHVLAGVIEPTRGTVTTIPRPAYVLQRSAVPDTLPLTVRAAVTMGVWANRGLVGRLSRDDRRLVDDCLDRLAIGDLARRQVAELSGGQRQRVLVAQGLAQRSSLLLLDEPVTGLDAVARGHILTAIADEVARGVVVVMSTHELSDAAEADQVVLLVDGSARAIGSSTDVLDPVTLATAYGQVITLSDDSRVLVMPPAFHHDHDH